jgi:hypothetical protein
MQKIFLDFERASPPMHKALLCFMANKTMTTGGLLISFCGRVF